jgi:hypothetical protein
MRRPPPLLGVLTFVAVAGVVAPGWGCIAFIHDDAGSYSTTCPFEGEDSSCGECVQTSCAVDLDGCCSDDACAPSLTLLDSCAGSGDLSACTSLANLTNVDAVEAALLGSCIQESCTMCGTRGGSTIADGGEADGATMSRSVDAAPVISCLGGDVGQECVCTVGGTDTGEPCNLQTVEEVGLCCAGAGWPTQAGTECTCKPFVCMGGEQAIDPVSCALAESTLGGESMYPNDTTDPDADPTCCSDGLTCTCRNNQNCENQTETIGCDVTDVSCPAGTTSVTSCSAD